MLTNESSLSNEKRMVDVLKEIENLNFMREEKKNTQNICTVETHFQHLQ